MRVTRRHFLSAAVGSSAVISLGARPPQFLLEAAMIGSSSPSTNVLVVVQLSGGNDGLNTIVPYADDDYRKSRPTLAIGQENVLKIDDFCGFHPAMRGFDELLQEGRLAIVPGVGYPDPNRSHFESMDFWHTCHRNQQRRSDGWLGRYLDAAAQDFGGDVPALHLGQEKQPLALTARNTCVPSVRSLAQFRLEGDNEQLRSAVGDVVEASRDRHNDLVDFVQSSFASALQASRRVEAASEDGRIDADYPESRLGEKLRTVAHLIDAGLTTRIYYVQLDGFDTHSRQAGAHGALLGQLSDAVSAFMKDLTGRGQADRALVMTFSEFGRRVQENASAGTDHGAAAPMFLAGGRVKPGLAGDHPSLTDLVDGDLKFHTDFRRVYATVLEDWLGWKSAPILGGTYPSLPLIEA